MSIKIAPKQTINSHKQSLKALKKSIHSSKLSKAEQNILNTYVKHFPRATEAILALKEYEEEFSAFKIEGDFSTHATDLLHDIFVDNDNDVDMLSDYLVDEFYIHNPTGSKYLNSLNEQAENLGDKLEDLFEDVDIRHSQPKQFDKIYTQYIGFEKQRFRVELIQQQLDKLDRYILSLTNWPPEQIASLSKEHPELIASYKSLHAINKKLQKLRTKKQGNLTDKTVDKFLVLLKEFSNMKSKHQDYINALRSRFKESLGQQFTKYTERYLPSWTTLIKQLNIPDEEGHSPISILCDSRLNLSRLSESELLQYITSNRPKENASIFQGIKQELGLDDYAPFSLPDSVQKILPALPTLFDRIRFQSGDFKKFFLPLCKVASSLHQHFDAFSLTLNILAQETLKRLPEESREDFERLYHHAFEEGEAVNAIPSHLKLFNEMTKIANHPSSPQLPIELLKQLEYIETIFQPMQRSSFPKKTLRNLWPDNNKIKNERFGQAPPVRITQEASTEHITGHIAIIPDPHERQWHITALSTGQEDFSFTQNYFPKKKQAKTSNDEDDEDYGHGLYLEAPGHVGWVRFKEGDAYNEHQIAEGGYVRLGVRYHASKVVKLPPLDGKPLLLGLEDMKWYSQDKFAGKRSKDLQKLSLKAMNHLIDSYQEQSIQVFGGCEVRPIKDEADQIIAWDVVMDNISAQGFTGTIAFEDSKGKNDGYGLESMPLPKDGSRAIQRIYANKDYGVQPESGQLLRVAVRGLGSKTIPLPAHEPLKMIFPYDLTLSKEVPTPSYFETEALREKQTEKKSRVQFYERGEYLNEKLEPAVHQDDAARARSTFNAPDIHLSSETKTNTTEIKLHIDSHLPEKDSYGPLQLKAEVILLGEGETHIKHKALKRRDSFKIRLKNNDLDSAQTLRIVFPGTGWFYDIDTEELKNESPKSRLLFREDLAFRGDLRPLNT